MKNVLSASNMKLLEQNTIEYLGIDAAVLMERAAYCVAEYIINNFPSDSSVLILSGTGNNGADGLCVSRILSERGYSSDIYILKGHKSTALFEKQKAVLDKLSASFVEDVKPCYDIYVDALTGIGYSYRKDDEFFDLIEKINSYNGFKISLDIPSGTDATTGEVNETAFCADVVFSFGAYKSGLFKGKAVDYYKKLYLVPAGIFDFDNIYDYKIPESKDILKILPKRAASSNKGTYGKVLIVAGSNKSCGCAILSAVAAFKAGAGMVKIVSHAGNKEAVYSACPDVMASFYDDGCNDLFFKEFTDDMSWADCVVIGPGIGINDFSKTLLDMVLENKSNVLFDADAINCLAEDEALLKKFLKKASDEKPVYVITPHKAESKRLLDSMEKLDSKIKCLDDLASIYGVICVDKDSRTRTLGNAVKYINPSGNDGLSVAGSGDVLSGILGAYFAFAVKNNLLNGITEMVAAGVYVHGFCADHISKSVDKSSIMASDLSSNIPMIYKELLKDGEDLYLSYY